MAKPFRLRPPQAPPLIENDVERQCLDLLRWRHYQPERLHTGVFRTLDGRRYIKGHAKGTPDYVVTHSLYPAFYLETKRPGKTPTAEQERRHAELQLNRLAVATVDGCDALLCWLRAHESSARNLWRAEIEKAHVTRTYDQTGDRNE